MCATGTREDGPTTAQAVRQTAARVDDATLAPAVRLTEIQAGGVTMGRADRAIATLGAACTMARAGRRIEAPAGVAIAVPADPAIPAPAATRHVARRFAVSRNGQAGLPLTLRAPSHRLDHCLLNFHVRHALALKLRLGVLDGLFTAKLVC